MPTTEAGQALLHAVIDPRLDEPILRSVDAIEDQARAEGYAAGLAAAREAVVKAVEPHFVGCSKEPDNCECASLGDNIRAIDSLSGSSSPHVDADLAVDP